MTACVTPTLQAVDTLTSEPTGPPLAGARLGAVLQLTVQVTTPDELAGGVSVEALMPGGLEPLDPLVEQGGAGSRCGATSCAH
jgi:hypothetical protein